MKRWITSLIILCTLSMNAGTCEETMDETIFYHTKSVTSDSTNVILVSLIHCDFDKYEIGFISNPEFFRQAIDDLTTGSNEDVKVQALVDYFEDFKKNDSVNFQVQFSENRQSIDFYSSILSMENLDSFIQKWTEFNGEQISSKLKKHIIEGDLLNQNETFKNVLNEFYFSEFEVLIFGDNLNGISWEEVSSEGLLGTAGTAVYNDKIKISVSKSDSKIVLSLELKEKWNIYSFGKGSDNIFGATLRSGNDCFEIMDGLEIKEEIARKDPMGIDGIVKLITGENSITFPYKENCEEPLKLVFTFSLINDDGGSLPFVKEIIEIH